MLTSESELEFHAKREEKREEENETELDEGENEGLVDAEEHNLGESFAAGGDAVHALEQRSD